MMEEKTSPLHRGVRWLKDLYLTSKGLMIGDARLYGRRDANNNFDPYWKRKDGTDVNLTGEALLARATSSLTLTTSYASITGDGNSNKVRLLLPSIGEWTVDATALLEQNGADDPGVLQAALFVNDSGTEESGDAVFRPQAAAHRATVSQRWKITTAAVNTPVELKAKQAEAGDGLCTGEHTNLSAIIGAGGGSTVETVDHGTLTGRGDDDHSQYGQLADAETVPGIWTFGNGLKTDTISEETGAAGVTIDSVLLKDGVVVVGDVAFDDATSNPVAVGDAAADGTENSVARKDHGHATGGTAGGDLGGTYPNPTVDDGADSTAIHDNVANEVTALVQVTPAAADEFVVEDNSDGYNKKAVLFSALEGALTHDNQVAGTIASHDTGATGAELDTLTDGSDSDTLHAHTNHGITHNAAHGKSKHTEHANWKVFHSDGSGDEQEAAVGADGTVYTGTAVDGAPEFGPADDHDHVSQAGITTVGALASGSLAAGFTDVPVPQGGTGASSFTEGGVLLGAAAGAIEVTDTGTVGSATALDEFLHAKGGTTNPDYKGIEQKVSFTCENPDTDDKFILGHFSAAATIQEIHTTRWGGTSVTWNLYQDADSTAEGTKVFDANQTTATANTATRVTPDTAAIAENDFLVLEITAQVGDPTQFHITVRYTTT